MLMLLSNLKWGCVRILMPSWKVIHRNIIKYHQISTSWIAYIKYPSTNRLFTAYFCSPHRIQWESANLTRSYGGGVFFLHPTGRMVKHVCFLERLERPCLFILSAIRMIGFLSSCLSGFAASELFYTPSI